MRAACLFSLIVVVCLMACPLVSLADSPVRFSTSIRVGFMIPEIEEYSKVYEDDYMFVYGLSVGWKMVKDLELVGEAGYGLKDGKGVTEEGERTGEKYRLHVAPALLDILYRLKFYEDQPVVPYLGGGANYAYFYESREEESDTNVHGGKWGYNGLAGLEILLDKYSFLC